MMKKERLTGLLLALSLVACEESEDATSEEIIDVVASVEKDETTDQVSSSVMKWTFTNTEDYVFDSQYISLSSGDASLMGFNLNLNYDSEADSSLAADWTPEFASIVTYIKLDGEVGNIGNGSVVAATIGTEGTSYDSSGSSMNFESSKVGQGITFDGVDDYVDLDANAASIPSGTSDFTFSVWVKFTVVPSSAKMILAYGGNNGDDGYVIMATSSSIGIYVLDGVGGAFSAVSNAAPQIDKWYYLVGTYDHNNLRFYIDGSVIATTESSAGIATATTLRVGNEAGRSYHVNAVIDELAIWSTALIGADVAEIYGYQQQKYLSISNKNPLTFSSLVSFSDANTEGCEPKYQLSNEGDQFSYWNGSAWAIAADFSHSNDSAMVNTNIGSFESGDLTWKVFLDPAVGQNCSLNEITVDWQ
jgi:hypothetical protein